MNSQSKRNMFLFGVIRVVWVFGNTRQPPFRSPRTIHNSLQLQEKLPSVESPVLFALNFLYNLGNSVYGIQRDFSQRQGTEYKLHNKRSCGSNQPGRVVSITHHLPGSIKEQHKQNHQLNCQMFAMHTSTTIWTNANLYTMKTLQTSICQVVTSYRLEFHDIITNYCPYFEILVQLDGRCATDIVKSDEWFWAILKKTSCHKGPEYCWVTFRIPLQTTLVKKKLCVRKTRQQY